LFCLDKRGSKTYRMIDVARSRNDDVGTDVGAREILPQSALRQGFDRFFRADTSRGQTEGSGLGLAIAKWIAETVD